MYQLIRVVYDEDCKSILDIVNLYKDIIEIETYSLNHFKEKKKAIPIMVRNGTKNVPLITLVQNEEEAKVLWSESNPDWKKELDSALIDNFDNYNIQFEEW